MALYVNTNVSSINGRRQLTNVTNSLSTTYQRLSSGLRINSAKDDAAGLQISDRLTSQINGLNQGNRNANDGIALAQTVEGAMDEMTNMLQRIRTLAVQSANGTNTTADRMAIQQEVTQLSQEITRIACKTTFGGQAVLMGGKDDATNGLLDKDGKLAFQIGANANDTISLDISQGFAVSSIDAAAANAINDTAMIKSAGATTMRFSVSTAENAQFVLSGIDSYIQVIDSKRAELGAIQNRMESTIRNQSNISQNESDARSRIRDTDFAEETANLSQQSIIQQAATSMLMQANSTPQIALSLLG